MIGFYVDFVFFFGGIFNFELGDRGGDNANTLVEITDRFRLLDEEGGGSGKLTGKRDGSRSKGRGEDRGCGD